MLLTKCYSGVQRMRTSRLVTRLEVKGIAYTVLVEKAKGKCLLGRPRRRWEGTIVMDIKNGMEGHGLD